MERSQSSSGNPAPSLPRLKIGPLVIDPPLLQAPMAGFTNYAYRQLLRRFGGVGLLVTEMLSARGFLETSACGGRFTERLWGIDDEPRPLAVQVWDNDPGALAAVAARLIGRFRASLIDLNFGCPVKKVSQKAKSGSYLLRDPERLGAIVARVVRACDPVPVTAKIRLGLTRDTINAVDVAQAVESAGGAAVTVHGRTAQELFRGSADWDRIAEIRPHLKRIPLIGNGDLKTPQSVVEAFRRYGVDGVMIGRAALGKPWLFRQVQAALAGEPVPPDLSLDEERQLLLDHYRLILDQFGQPKGTILMRKFACLYAQGHRGARAFRLRVTQASTREQFIAVVEKHFPRS
jgi:tRNA-dihydrouridine synthase B